MTYTFDRAITFEAAGDHRWTATIEDGWDVAGVPDGGYTLALALAALGDAVSPPDPITATAHYLTVAKPGPVVIEGAVIRAGRSHATVTGIVRQDDRPIISVLATFGDLERDVEGPELSAPVHRLPPPGECVGTDPAGGRFPIPLLQHVDIRLAPESVGFAGGTPSGRGLVEGWIRFADGREPSVLAAALFADSFPPAVFNSGLPVAWTPTVELTVHFRKRPAPGWLRGRFETRFVSRGYLEEDGELWDTDDQLVADSRQLAVVPRS